MKTITWRFLIVAAMAAAGLATGPAFAASSAAVDIKEFKFIPQVLTVPVGTTVTWINDDEEPHTITSAQGAFGSSGLSYHEGFSQTFARPGRYEYFCALHPHMKATVIVR